MNKNIHAITTNTENADKYSYMHNYIQPFSHKSMKCRIFFSTDICPPYLFKIPNYYFFDFFNALPHFGSFAKDERFIKLKILSCVLSYNPYILGEGSQKHFKYYFKKKKYVYFKNINFKLYAYLSFNIGLGHMLGAE